MAFFRLGSLGSRREARRKHLFSLLRAFSRRALALESWRPTTFTCFVAA